MVNKEFISLQDILKEDFGITASGTENDVFVSLESIAEKIRDDFTSGITVNLRSEDGFIGTYCRGEKYIRFNIVYMFLGNEVVREMISGRYRTPLGEVTVTIDRERSSQFINCRVFLNGKMIFVYTNPYDSVSTQADDLIIDINRSNNKDLGNITNAFSRGNDSFAFVLKMLEDYRSSVPDRVVAKKIFDTMSKDPRSTVRWNKQ